LILGIRPEESRTCIERKAVARISAGLADTFKLDDIDVARAPGLAAKLINCRDSVVSVAARPPRTGAELKEGSRAAYSELEVLIIVDFNSIAPIIVLCGRSSFPGLYH